MSPRSTNRYGYEAWTGRSSATGGGLGGALADAAGGTVAARGAEPANRPRVVRLEEGRDRGIHDSEAPFFVAKGPTSEALNRIPGLPREESHHLRVRGNFEDGSRRGRGRAIHIRGVIVEEVS